MCGSPLGWKGSLSRGANVCPLCTSDGKRSLILVRYSTQVNSWHRDWCAAIVGRKAGKTDPKQCDCGHTQPTPHTEQQIEQRERATYGEAI